MCITYILESQEHQWMQHDSQMCWCILVSECWSTTSWADDSGHLKSPWQQTSYGHRVSKHMAHQWRPISHWARTWWRDLAPGPRWQRQSRRSKHSPSRMLDKWGCAKHSVSRESWQMTTFHRISCHWSNKAEPAPTRSLRSGPAWTHGGFHTFWAQ